MQAGGMLLFYNVEQVLVQIRMNERIHESSNSFETLILSKVLFEKVKVNASELEINGKMYDIKSLEQKNDQLVLKVLKDDDESLIINAIKRLMQNSNRSKNNFPRQLQQLITFDYLQPSTQNYFILTENSIQFSRNLHFQLLLNYLSKTTPPPKIV